VKFPVTNGVYVRRRVKSEPLRERSAPKGLTADYRERDGTRREKESGKDGYICSRPHTLLHREAQNAHRDPLEEPRDHPSRDFLAARFRGLFIVARMNRVSSGAIVTGSISS